MMETIRAAIFDLDGTLVDSMYVWSKVDEDFLTQRGIPVTEEYTDKMRSMFFETAAAYTKDTYGLEESVEEIMQVWLDMAHYEYANNVRAKKGALEFLLSMKEKGIALGMATSNNPYLLKPCLDNNAGVELLKHGMDESMVVGYGLIGQLCFCPSIDEQLQVPLGDAADFLVLYGIDGSPDNLFISCHRGRRQHRPAQLQILVSSFPERDLRGDTAVLCGLPCCCLCPHVRDAAPFLAREGLPFPFPILRPLYLNPIRGTPVLYFQHNISS